jgi:hypothetical protein
MKRLIEAQFALGIEADTGLERNAPTGIGVNSAGV